MPRLPACDDTLQLPLGIRPVRDEDISDLPVGTLALADANNSVAELFGQPENANMVHLGTTRTAVAAIGVYQFFGQTIRNQTAGIAREVSGQTADTAIQNARTAADAAESEGNRKKGLGAYQNNESR